MIEIVSHGVVDVLHIKYGKANVQDLEFCQELLRWLEELRSSNARALVLTGQGKLFSAGVDLKRVIAGGEPYIREFLPILSQLYETLFFYPKPVVSAINGHAVAGGCVLACLADYKVMALDEGRIGVPELLVGVPFPMIAFEIMRFVCDPQHFEELLYGGATFPVESAYSLGLVNKLVEPERLLEYAIGVAEKMATLPAEAFALTKQQIRAPVLKRLREDGAEYDSAVLDCWASQKSLASIQEYVLRTLQK
ncbi:enoyl-CoA hydratase/isomerase family protein [Candidatus Chlorohelix sp.]|uniref:enoyl-CoA hydratase/isomerase family protein n=1 Tax=Candidatus Chlorohelix sp. TaxID=3139201 RepID=UPI0030383526